MVTEVLTPISKHEVSPVFRDVRIVFATSARVGRMHGFAAIDLETTGLSPSSDRIIEIGVVVLDEQCRELEQWSTLVNPGRPVGATFVHGITDHDVAAAPFFTEVLPVLVPLLRGRAIVAHNAPFDVGFLNAAFGRASFPLRIPAAATVDTLEQSRIYLPEGRHSLVAATARAGIPLPTHHRALGDARAAAGLLRVYMEREAGGVRFAEEARTRDGAPVYPRSWMPALKAAAHVPWPDPLF